MQSRNPNNSRGIDISHYQTVSSWQRVRDSGIVDFVYAKASQGISWVDSSFLTHVAGARSVGLPVGAYHYLDAGDQATAIAEAENFAMVIAGLPLELDPVVDVEDAANTAEAALAFLQRFEKVTGRRPMVYTYPSFIDEKLSNALADYRLWYAYYNADGTPADRGGWTEWTFLQYSEKGYVPGIDGPVDLDEFNGRVEDVFNEINKLQAQCQTLLNTAEAHIERIVQLEGAVKQLNEKNNMSCPDWAKDAIVAAMNTTLPNGQKLVDTPDGGSYDFYRLVTILHRANII
ncbi:hypothetical protein SD70_02620 [Gordoniibacillus kamchatkensis]|uniref:Lysozyme n=1 Tax=Gordoniibacillus kamchatkensis TaxID=1590651 RepID=A0ABR5AMD7_9BACL|nr:glycoside hydrolase family 25 protein [Paenibacillus sp. VKM B-2647]KIL42096.1 hypothetical protein SD70_02620 [Paenibacillus sp. VKM B-2647]